MGAAVAAYLARCAGRTLTAGEECLVQVLRQVGCGGETAVKMLTEDFDLDCLLVSSLADLVEIGIEPLDASKLERWAQHS